MSLEQRNASPLFFLCLSVCPGGCLEFLCARVMKKVRNGRNAVKHTTAQLPFWSDSRTGMLVARKTLPVTRRRRTFSVRFINYPLCHWGGHLNV